MLPGKRLAALHAQAEHEQAGKGKAEIEVLAVQQNKAALTDADAAKVRLHDIAAEVEAAQSRLDSLRE